MLGSDIVVAQLSRFVDRKLEHALGARRERDLADRERAAGRGDHALHRLADGVQVESQIIQNGGGDAFSFPDDSEEKVLGPDVIVLQPGRLFAREVHHFSHAFRELVMHDSKPPAGSPLSKPPYPSIRIHGARRAVIE